MGFIMFKKQYIVSYEDSRGTYVTAVEWIWAWQNEVHLLRNLINKRKCNVYITYIYKVT